MKKFFLELDKKLKQLMVEKNCFIKKYARIRANTDDDLSLSKLRKFATLAIIIKCVYYNNEKRYPQIHLDKCLHGLQKSCNTI